MRFWKTETRKTGLKKVIVINVYRCETLFSKNRVFAKKRDTEVVLANVYAGDVGVGFWRFWVKMGSCHAFDPVLHTNLAAVFANPRPGRARLSPARRGYGEACKFTKVSDKEDCWPRFLFFE
jgi:hypothetical protein